MQTVLTLFFRNISEVEDHIDHNIYKVSSFKYQDDLKDVFAAAAPHVVLLEFDGEMKSNLMDILKNIWDIRENIPVIVVGPSGDSKLIVDCIKNGVFDFVPKPYRRNDLNLIIESALKSAHAMKIAFDKGFSDDEDLRNFFGVSRQVQNVLEQVKMISMTDMSIMILGASGTGKEVIANLIHSLSPRKKENFIPIDCGALPEPLLESELFGYERGAFTGAYAEKPGMIELADKGTLFLDEIGNLSVMNQTKLLRFLEDHKVQRLGGQRKKVADVRVIVATNVDLREAVKDKTFRLDLYHRLSEFSLTLPLLIERKEDIPILGNNFLKEAGKKLKKNIEGITTEAMEILLDYEWPGNVRELKNVITSAALIADHMIRPEHLKIQLASRESKKSSLGELDFQSSSFSLKKVVKQAVKEIEKKYIVQSLIASKGNRTQAAKKLKIDRTALYQKIREYDIQC